MLSPVRATLLTAVLGLPLSQPIGAIAQPPATTPAAKPAPAAGPAQVDPAAKEFIEKFRALAKTVNDFSCTATQSMTTGSKTERQSGDLVLVFSRDPDGMATVKQFKITSKPEGMDAIWSFDGTTAYKIDNSAKTIAHLESGEHPAMPVPQIAALIPSWLRGSDVLSQEGAKLVGARFLPDVELDGVKCRVVEYRVEVIFPDTPEEEASASKESKAEPRKMTMVQTRHVGASDLVSRKIESRTSFTGVPDAEPRTFLAAYTNVKINTSPSAESFALKAPEGYTVAKARAKKLGVMSDKPDLDFDVGDTAPDFTLKSADGSDVSLASLKGRVVLLDFWATWCGPCKMAMPGVQKLHEKYAGKKVSVFGVDTWERAKTPEEKMEKARAYMASKKYTYGLLFDGDSLAKQYDMSGIPTFILIGRDGKILYVGVGYEEGQDEKLSEIIDHALAGA